MAKNWGTLAQRHYGWLFNAVRVRTFGDFRLAGTWLAGAVTFTPERRTAGTELRWAGAAVAW